MTSEVIVAVDGGVMTVTIDRPERMNAFRAPIEQIHIKQIIYLEIAFTIAECPDWLNDEGLAADGHRRFGRSAIGSDAFNIRLRNV